MTRTFQLRVVQKNYARIAWMYDFWSRLTEARAAEKGLEMAQIQNGGNILEVAVGTGILFEKIVKHNKRGINIGVDISPSMLSRAAKRLKKFDSKYFHLQCGNAFHLAFKDNQFDLIVNNYMFDLLPEEDFEVILLEFKRVLKNSGKLVIATMAHGKKRVNQIWNRVAKAFPGLLTGCRPVSMQSHLTSAGFSNIQVVNFSQNTFPSEVIRAEG